MECEGRCWGADEPGREFEKAYQPNAERMARSLQNLAAILHYTGAAINQSANEFDHRDFDNARHVAGARPGAAVGDSALLGHRPPDLYHDALQQLPTGTGSGQPLSAHPADRPAISGSAAGSQAPGESTDAPLNSRTGAAALDSGIPAEPGAITSGAPAAPHRQAGGAQPSVSVKPQTNPITNPLGLARMSGQTSGRYRVGGADASGHRPAVVTARPERGAAGDEEIMRHPWARPGQVGPRRGEREKDRRRRAAVVGPDVTDRPPVIHSAMPGQSVSTAPPVDRKPGPTPWSKRGAADSARTAGTARGKDAR